jgi:hypothetical protein
LSEPITSGRVVDPQRLASSAMIRSAIARPAVEVESGISLPIDHMTTAGELRAARTISVASFVAPLIEEAAVVVPRSCRVRQQSNASTIITMPSSSQTCDHLRRGRVVRGTEGVDAHRLRMMVI